jgi:hypothetical protein
VTALEPGRLLEYDWDGDGAAGGRVRWELRRLDFGTGLVLTQTLPAAPPELRPMALATWERHVQRLVATLHAVGE